MPFDGKNFQQTKPDVFSLPSLIEWLEKQPADREYNYVEPRQCVLGQYTTHHGGKYVCPGSYYVIGSATLLAGLSGLGDLNKVVGHHPYTFGAALYRARALLAAR